MRQQGGLPVCGLVRPTDAEKVSGGYRLKKAHTIDPDQQVEAALDAFKAGQFLVLVDEAQVEALDQEIIVRPETTATFLKLVPLWGG